ncbi:MAG: alpha/beta hydrolase, partial [Thermoanaerobaculia bacterium]
MTTSGFWKGARKTARIAGTLLGVGVAALVVWCLIPLAPTVAAMRPRPETRYWEMSRGYRIAYSKIPAQVAPDSAPGAPILFLHGGPGGYVHSSVLRTLAPLAREGHDLYFYDQVGSGLSDRLPRPKDYSFLGHVADLEEIVARHVAAGDGKVILIGHSYGGFLAAEYVALHPEHVERLVLSSPG